MTEGPFVLPLRDCHVNVLVGGKALNLARLIQAGFPVPDGFVVTTHAFRAAVRGDSLEVPEQVSNAILSAYRALGSPTVAVRSSATAEDMAAASMAGQYETYLDLENEEQVLDAVQRCWNSLDTPRTRTYLSQHGIKLSDVAMAVVVQRLIPSEVAGVLFTANPQTGHRGEMLIEASWGLGEAVVSGIVQPDTLVIDRATGAALTTTIGDKRVWIEPGSHAERPVPEERRHMPCLNSRNVHDLLELGQEIMDHFGSPQDVEWAIHGGSVYLLQSRNITTLEEAEAYQECLRETRSRLREEEKKGRGDWVLHNIAETLPHPHPLTWSVIGRFMSGSGGFGEMYRFVGFEPSEDVSREGFLELIAGRPYMDLARAPDLFFEDYPYQYDPQELQGRPDAAQSPPTIPTGSFRRQVAIGRKVAKVAAKLDSLAETFDRDLEERIVPAFAKWVEEQRKKDLASLPVEDWIECWRECEQKVLQEFAPMSLVPSLLAAHLLEKLRLFLEEHFWDDDPEDLANLLASGGPPDKTLLANQALKHIATGEMPTSDWLVEHGHRAPEEFDLATPRWRERPDQLEALAARLADAPDPLELHKRGALAANARLDKLKSRLGLRDQRELVRLVGLVHRYLRFREDGKFYLMLGYEQLRALALEAARRLDVDAGVFFLTSEEIRDSLVTGYAPLRLIEQRRIRHRAESKVHLQQLIRRDFIDRIGEPPVLEAKDCMEAFALSPGSASGPARIVFRPEEAGELGTNYILVCPSTDPNWTPLFVNAAGIVLESGGSLSHGAVVAREIGIPAVVVPDATRLLEDGETITLDGHHGALLRGEAGEKEASEEREESALSAAIPRELVPPPPGRKERLSGKLRNIFLALWGLYLLLVFILPAPWLREPSMRVLDAILWPLVQSAGMAGTVAIVAAILAVLTMTGQRFLTDNRRLLAAKRRATQLRKQTKDLPPDSPRRKLALRLARPVQSRILGAAFVPLAIILGPMIMSFLWFPERVDPAAWNPAPDAVIHVTAMIDGDYTDEVRIEAQSPLALDEDRSPAAQRIVPQRRVLEEYYAETLRKPSDLSDQPWELQAAAMQAREEMLADLRGFLQGEMPDMPLSWTLRNPQGETGRYEIRLQTDESAPPVIRSITLGDAAPPAPALAITSETEGGPIKEVQIHFLELQRQGTHRFYEPFRRLGWSWDAGWLGVYLAVYLVLMLALKFLLRIP